MVAKLQHYFKYESPDYKVLIQQGKLIIIMLTQFQFRRHNLLPNSFLLQNCLGNFFSELSTTVEALQ